MKTTTFELELPRNMRPMARAAFKALDGDTFPPYLSILLPVSHDK